MSNAAPSCVLNFICHGSTPAVRKAAFPGDEALDQFGERDCRANGTLKLRAEAKAWVAPELRARQTAELLGLNAETVPALRECDFGQWKGRRLEDLMTDDPDGALRWISNPEAAPHGGESYAHLFRRVSEWMEQARALPVQHVIVTHASVMRAAVAYARGQLPLDAMKIDVGPLTTAAISWDGTWRLQDLRRWHKQEPLVLL